MKQELESSVFSETGATHILKDLNEAQRKAVLHGEGPLLIVAGAGTGKSTVLTKRIAHLIASKKALPSEILALTFTDKAAQEMEERVDKLVPYGFNDVWVSTFHSFGDRILRENAFEIGLSPDLKVLTLPEAMVFFRQNLFKFGLERYRPLGDPTRFIESLLNTFSRAKDEEIGPEEFIHAAREMGKIAGNKEEKDQAKKTLEIAEAYKTYEGLKSRMGFIDFGDQVLLTLKLLRESASALKRVRSRFKYILVDEFQDTNYAQFEMIKFLAQPHRNITVVGDDDQSIYKFRGACLSNILSFRSCYAEAEEIVLQENYRSTQEILDCAYKLIQHNNPDRLEFRDNLNKILRSQKSGGVRVRYTLFEDLYSESEFVANEIKARMEKPGGKGPAPGDFAVLVRTNASAESFIKSLNLAGIPWKFSGNAGLYEQEEILASLSFLRVLDDPQDSASLYYLALSDLYQVGAENLSILAPASSKRNVSLWELLQSCLKRKEGQELPELPGDSRGKIETLVSDVTRFRKLSSKMRTGNLLYKFFEERGLLKKLAESGELRDLQTAQNLHRFFDIIKKFGAVCQYDRVHTFVQYADALRTAGDSPSSAEVSFGEDAVNILTVHAAKGLEFPVVFLVGLEQGHFPVTNRGELIEFPEKLIKETLPAGNTHLQEERRLFYVGLTRAKDELILTSARDLGKKKLWKTSQFVLECLDKPSADEKVYKTNALESLKIFSEESSSSIKERSAAFAPDLKNSATILLSATSIEDYLTCPLKYKFAQVLRIPVLMHHTAVFGNAVHEALKCYHLARKERKKIGLEEILNVFKKSWRSEGFVSREHEEKRLREGTKILKAYYKSEEKSGRIPSLVEENFKMALSSSARIRGRWDRVDLGEKNAVIIDYKTGDVRDQEEADQKARTSVQLSIYSAAFKNRFGEFPSRTVLNFVKAGLTGTAVPTEEKVEKVLSSARETADRISRKIFDPRPGYHCRWCAYEKICPSADRGA